MNKFLLRGISNIMENWGAKIIKDRGTGFDKHVEQNSQGGQAKAKGEMLPPPPLEETLH